MASPITNPSYSNTSSLKPKAPIYSGASCFVPFESLHHSWRVRGRGFQPRSHLTTQNSPFPIINYQLSEGRPRSLLELSLCPVFRDSQKAPIVVRCNITRSKRRKNSIGRCNGFQQGWMHLGQCRNHEPILKHVVGISMLIAHYDTIFLHQE